MNIINVLDRIITITLFLSLNVVAQQDIVPTWVYITAYVIAFFCVGWLSYDVWKNKT